MARCSGDVAGDLGTKELRALPRSALGSPELLQCSQARCRGSFPCPFTVYEVQIPRVLEGTASRALAALKARGRAGSPGSRCRFLSSLPHGCALCSLCSWSLHVSLLPFGGTWGKSLFNQESFESF